MVYRSWANQLTLRAIPTFIRLYKVQKCKGLLTSWAVASRRSANAEHFPQANRYFPSSAEIVGTFWDMLGFPLHFYDRLHCGRLIISVRLALPGHMARLAGFYSRSR